MNSSNILVKTFSFRPEAERAQQVLEAAGITTAVRGDDASGWAPHIGFAAGGIGLFVNPNDLDQATKLLEDPGKQAVP